MMSLSLANVLSTQLKHLGYDFGETKGGETKHHHHHPPPLERPNTTTPLERDQTPHDHAEQSDRPPNYLSRLHVDIGQVYRWPILLENPTTKFSYMASPSDVVTSIWIGGGGTV